MNSRPIRPLATAIALSLSLPLAAHSAPEPNPATIPLPVTAEVDSGADAEEVVVTARRREESAQAIPIAVSVVGGEHLESTGTFNIGRLQQIAPTLQFYSSNPRNTALNIRGIGSPFGLTNDGIEQGVGLYIDDVYHARVATATLDFLDVAQVEVLRGPQGTLYGKNTTAGAINLTTRQPDFDHETRAELSFGNLGFRQVKGAVSGPLSETFAARLAVSATDRKGTIRNVATGRQINALDNLGVRATLLWKPADGIDVTLAADYSNQNPECCAQIYVRTGATQRALNRQYAALAAAQNYAVPSTNAFDRLTDVDAALSAGNRLGGASVRVRWELGAGTLTSVSAWRSWDWKPANDRDFTGLPIYTKVNNPSQQQQLTQELRYAWSGRRLDVVAGLFGFRQQVRTQGITQNGPAASRWLLNPSSALSRDPTVLDGLTANNDIRLDNTSAALFGQVAWHLTDRLTLQPGLRLNFDRKNGLYDSVVTNGAGQLVTFASTDPRIVQQRGVQAPQRFAPRFADWNFSHDLTLSHELAPDVFAYATVAHTFKSGGINLNGVPNDAAGNPLLAAGTVKPESVRHHEVGLKTRFPESGVTLNLAAFRTDIGDYQALVTNGQLGVVRGYLANARRVRTQGVEWDLSYRVSEHFNAYLNGSFNDATYRQFADAPCPPELSGGGTATPISAPGVPGNSPANCNISGSRLPGVSRWSVSYGVEWNAPVALRGREFEAYAGVDGNFRSNFSSNPSPSAYTWVDGYGLANLRFGVRTENGVDVQAWVRNALDTRYFEQLAVPSGNTGLIVGQPGDPRTWGLSVRVAF